MTEATSPDARSAVVVGACGGLGRALGRALAERDDVARVFAVSRHPLDCANDANEKTICLEADACDPPSLARAAEAIARTTPRIHVLIICTGILHGGNSNPGLSPEKSLGQLDGDAFRQVMTVNALAPLQVLHAFAPLLKHDQRAVAAALSAMVGSIGDNRIGGWYSYRMSKAALNMGLKNAAIELGRLRPRGRPTPIVVAVHPGTTETDLSRPFLREHDARSADDSASQILAVLEGLEEEDSGRFFNWDGRELPW